MAGLVVARTVPPARSQLPASPTHVAVLVAVALGVLFGAMSCAAGLAGGVAHGAAEPSPLEMDGMPSAHAHHLDSPTGSRSQPTAEGHGGHSGDTSTSGSHPGTACVVSVDLHFPETSSVSISDSFEILVMDSRSGSPADVDPPVPRCS